MNLLKKLFPTPPASSSSPFYSFAVQCNRCGETIEGRINLANDLSADYEDDRLVYHVRKVVMGSGKCFQQIEVEFTFNSSHQVLEQHILGGRLMEKL
ncbi:MAG: hypothetical protein ACM3MF_03595 [Anaerolineae bacterium]